MKKKDKDLDYELRVTERSVNGQYVNLYIYIDGYRFELVPHTRSVKETALYYSLLKKSKLACAD